MSKIQWTDQTWNPVTGCNKVSRGCKNCYAEVMHKRLRAMNSEKYQKPFLDGAVTHHDSLKEPFTWKKPRMVFVNSMSDLFHEYVSFDFIDKVFSVMAQTPQHTYQILTKRPERMLEFFNWQVGEYNLPNVWLGTSVENQEQANKRIPYLLQCPAAVRFLSCEPLVGAVDLNRIVFDRYSGTGLLNCLDGIERDHLDGILGETGRIHWVIAGGESGPKAQPMHPDWVRTLRDQCQKAGVPFFFKQWGNWKEGSHIDLEKNIVLLNDGTKIPYMHVNRISQNYPPSKWNALNPTVMHRSNNKKGNLLFDRKYEEFPEVQKELVTK